MLKRLWNWLRGVQTERRKPPIKISYQRNGSRVYECPHGIHAPWVVPCGCEPWPEDAVVLSTTSTAQVALCVPSGTSMRGAEPERFEMACFKGHKKIVWTPIGWMCEECEKVEAGSSALEEIPPPPDVDQIAVAITNNNAAAEGITGQSQLLELPGGVVFDLEEFKKFSADHPEYAAMQKQNQGNPVPMEVRIHDPVGGMGAVGISLRGAADPGPGALLSALGVGKEDSRTEALDDMNSILPKGEGDDDAKR